MKKDKSNKSKKSESSQRPKAKFGADLNYAATEAFNLLRTNVIFSLVDAEEKIIGLTSPSPQEGKSYTSINLAYSLAETGNKVILLDCDLRRPSVAKSLGLNSTPGLSEFLVSEDQCVVHEKVLSDNLSIVTSGEIPPNPSELLGSARMESTLKRLSKSFDYVILDLPPVNAVADPLVVSQYITGMILVVRHGSTKRGEAMEAMRQLQLSRVNVLGFVYNAYSSSGKGYFKGHYRYYRGYYRNGYYRYGYGYGYGYRYGHSKKETKNVEYGPDPTSTLE